MTAFLPSIALHPQRLLNHYTTPTKPSPSSITPLRPPTASSDNYTTVLLIPTGVGATIGGYAGDALPAARLLSSVTDTLITHPNVLNGALMYWSMPNALYVEGYALDLFATSRLRLLPTRTRANRIGLLLDSALTPELRLRHLQAADAARATLGLPVLSTLTTSRPLGVQLARSPAGPSWGTLHDPAALITAATTLQEHGCDALAVVAAFPDEDADALADYRAGTGVDAIAGAEAVISHLVTRALHIPCAHAPGLPPLDADPALAPKAAAEELGYTFLTCVLVGLTRAPKLLPAEARDGLGAEDVDAVVVPADAFGGPALMALAARSDVLVIAVEENATALDVPPEAVGIDRGRVVFAKSYAEAAGFIAAHKAGIFLPALSTKISSLAAAA